MQNETTIRPPIMATINVMAKLSNGCGGVGPVRSQRRRIVSEPADSLVSQVLFIEIVTQYDINNIMITRFYSICDINKWKILFFHLLYILNCRQNSLSPVLYISTYVDFKHVNEYTVNESTECKYTKNV